MIRTDTEHGGCLGGAFEIMPDPFAVAGFSHHAGVLDEPTQRRIVCEIEAIVAQAPLYRPEMPKTGRPLSVRMTNCGALGWVSSRQGGYRYQATHPETGQCWPPIPAAILAVWRDLAGTAAQPEACLVNWYAPDARLGLHVDRDEQDFRAPVVSISLGDDAWFRVGGARRHDPTARVLLRSGDVVVFGGEARLIHHGIDRIVPGTCHLLDEPGRYNLTLRRVTRISGA